MFVDKLFKFLFISGIMVAAALLPAKNCPAADGYMNAAPPSHETPPEAPRFAPGLTIALPGGVQSVITEELPNGNFRTRDGFVISPEGVLQNGPDQGATITIAPNISGAENAINFSGAVAPGKEESGALPSSPEKTTIPAEPEAAPAPSGMGKKNSDIPDETKLKTPDIAVVPGNREDPKKEEDGVIALLPSTPSEQAKPEAKRDAKPDENAEKPKDLTLAQMLPLTQVNQPPPKTPSVQEKPKAPESKEQKTKPKPEKEPAPKAKKPEPKAKPEPPAKPKAGEPMRIPESALKSGNLSFLEGCWEGTRPEYTTKRTIKECFCFGKDGKSGKRRIYDRQYGRTCIGASRANLSKSGVLSVTSAPMPCSDGEKWGGAEMQCRNTGPRTPCSWIFTDAGNGRQAYEIPFLRVNSCGR